MHHNILFLFFPNNYTLIYIKRKKETDTLNLFYMGPSAPSSSRFLFPFSISIVLPKNTLILHFSLQHFELQIQGRLWQLHLTLLKNKFILKVKNFAQLQARKPAVSRSASALFTGRMPDFLRGLLFSMIHSERKVKGESLP